MNVHISMGVHISMQHKSQPSGQAVLVRAAAGRRLCPAGLPAALATALALRRCASSQITSSKFLEYTSAWWGRVGGRARWVLHSPPTRCARG